MNDQQRIEITMASRVEYVNLIHAANLEVCRLLNLDEDTAMNLGLALHEAAVNAVKHGNRLDPALKVVVAFSIRPGELLVTVTDQGAGFDAAGVEDPRHPGNIEKTNGRGLFLMRSFVDQVSFDFVPGRGMTVSLLKKLPGRERRGSAGAR
jgi:serine/threonine-protein kinase RsbW